MKITTSYAAEIKNINKIARQTSEIYQGAVSYLVCVANDKWDELQTLPETGNARHNAMEKLIHRTKNNTPEYGDFDSKFPKLPSYLRRAAVSIALGHVSSYRSNLANWEANPVGKVPSFQSQLHKLPSFYRDGMYKDNGLADDTAQLKLFVNNDWRWVTVRLKHTDVVSIRKHMAMGKMSVPTLEKKNKKYFLRFAFTEEVTLTQKDFESQRICAVDLGINNDAVCSVMTADGTIHDRKFINFPCEKDHLYHTLNKIKKVQQTYGSHNTTRLWRHARNHNIELSKKIATAIANYAASQNCDVIVLEHLDMQGKIKGTKKQKLHLWRKRAIAHMVELKAHRFGMRFSTICAWGTSKLAFDGSGEILRGRVNLHKRELRALLAMSPEQRKDAKGRAATHCKADRCTFQNGKEYNCDLSASYNIGARYFIREIQKSIPATVWSGMVAKVPDCQKRTQCTYATLLQLNQAA